MTGLHIILTGIAILVITVLAIWAWSRLRSDADLLAYEMERERHRRAERPGFTDDWPARAIDLGGASGFHDLENDR